MPAVSKATGKQKSSLINEWKRYGIGAEDECFCECVNPKLESLWLEVSIQVQGIFWIFLFKK
jgi:hypothetical protein